jgi:hypothetical protein
MRHQQVLVGLFATVWCVQGQMEVLGGFRSLDGGYTPCQDKEWPSTTFGAEIIPQAVDKELWKALAEVDPQRIKANILKLVSFGTRHTLSVQNDTTRGIGAARDWIAAEMRGYAQESNGDMTVKVNGYLQGNASRISFPVMISNVVATLTGSIEPDRVYVVSGHYDSRISDVMDYTHDAPGANDDASGVAGILIST